jgi:hypothetical protein
MRNVWKGLVIGGLTGALVGTLMDVLRAENLERVASRPRRLEGAASPPRALGCAAYLPTRGRFQTSRLRTATRGSG